MTKLKIELIKYGGHVLHEWSGAYSGRMGKDDIGSWVRETFEHIDYDYALVRCNDQVDYGLYVFARF